MRAPIHIERPVIGHFRDAFIGFAKNLGIKPTMDPHVTLVHSTTPVDWDHPAFELDPENIQVVPTGLHMEMWEPRLVLVVRSKVLSDRNSQLINAGATSDFDHYNAHIKIGKDLDGVMKTVPGDPRSSDYPVFGCRWYDPITLGPERTCETKDFIKLKSAAHDDLEIGA